MPGCQQCGKFYRAARSPREPDRIKDAICSRCKRKPSQPNSVPKKQALLKMRLDNRQGPKNYTGVEGLHDTLSASSMFSVRPGAKVYIAFDFGTSLTKCTYRVSYTERGFESGSEERNILNEIETITFPNGETSVPSEIAWEKVSLENGGSTYRQIWGHEVADALRSGCITADTAFRELKPVVLGVDYPETSSTSAKILKLHPSLQKTRRARVNGHGWSGEERQVEPIDLFSEFIGHVYRYVLRKISQCHDELGWPKHEPQFQHWNPPYGATIHCAILLPVASTPSEQELVLAAAKAAGIQDAVPMGEPTAALIHHVRLTADRNDRHTIAILDIGAGSSDLQIWTVEKKVPLRVREEVVGKTIWCGGGFVSKNGTRLLLAGIEDQEAVLASVRSYGEIKTFEQFHDHIERKFDTLKRRFNIDTTRNQEMIIRGLPDLPDQRMRGINKFELSASDFEAIYEPQVREIIRLIREMQKRAKRDLSKILMVGGGSCENLRRRVEKEFCKPDNPGKTRTSYEVPVVSPSEAQDTTATKGAILLLADRDMVQMRVIRRGYCVTWDREVDDPSVFQASTPGNLRLYEHDDKPSLIDMTKVLILPGDTVPRLHVASERGHRSLTIDEESDQNGWTIEEHLYFTDILGDKKDMDDVWVDKVPTPWHRMANLEFHIKQDAAHSWARKTCSRTQTEFYTVEYEVSLILDDDLMTFQLLIPAKGQFGAEPRQRNDIVVQGRYDVAGVFRLFDPSE